MRKRETFGCYNSLLMSDLGLVNQKAIWSNCMRINIEMFEERTYFLAWLKRKFQKSIYNAQYHRPIIYYFRSQIKLHFTAHIK